MFRYVGDISAISFVSILVIVYKIQIVQFKLYEMVILCSIM